MALSGAGSYRLLGRLEAGELADLFLGARAGDDREVVIKLFHPQTSDPRYAQKLAEPASVLNGVQHRGLLHFLEVGLVQKRLAVVREHLDGLSLGQALGRLNSKEVLLHPPLALFIALELCDAVGAAHDAGVVHGAITPGNILLSREGEVGLFDFGAIAALQASSALRAFAARGRSTYRAPEVSQGEEPTTASDVYSIGAILYELLTLREPAGKAGGVSTRREAIPPPSRLDRRLNARIDPVVMRAIDPAAARRFHSCADFAEGIRNFLSQSGGLPSRDELCRLVAELDAASAPQEPERVLPFSESFRLSPVDGAELPPVEAAPDGIGARPSFSRGGLEDSEMEGAATQQESAPAFETFKPRRSMPELPPVGENERTNPGGAGPLEAGWEAPPGAAPPKPKSKSAPPPSQGTGLRSRVRVFDDLSPAPAKPYEPPDLDAPPEPTTGRRRAARAVAAPASSLPPPPELPNDTVAMEPVARNRFEVEPDEEELAEREKRRREKQFTEEQRLAEIKEERGRMTKLAVGLGFVGLAIFGIALYKFSPENERPKPPPVEAKRPGPSRDSTVNQAVAAALHRAELEQKKRDAEAAANPDKKPTPPPEQPKPVIEAAFIAAPRQKAAFLTVKSNVPSHVWVDGARVKGQTPFKKLQVLPGKREVQLRAVGTGETEVLDLTLVRGKERSVFQKFAERPR